MSDSTMISVVLADSNSLFRSALRSALESEADITVCAEASDPSSASALVTAHRPDLLLADIDLSAAGGGLRLSAEVRDDSASLLSVLLLVNRHSGSQLLNALEVGAQGCVSREDGLGDVIFSVRAAVRGEACVPRRLLGGLLTELIAKRRDGNEVTQRFARLSRREREVLSLLSRGMNHPDIAAALVISPQTARSHIQNILAKLEVHSRLEAATLAVEHGLVS